MQFFLLFLFILSHIVCQIVKFVSTLTPLIQNVQHDTSMLLGKESEVPFNILLQLPDYFKGVMMMSPHPQTSVYCHFLILVNFCKLQVIPFIFLVPPVGVI